MAEAYAPISTYHYGMNNPIFFIDPDGMSSKVPPKNMPKEYRDREKLDIYKDEANPVRGLGQGTGPVYGGDNGASQQNCPTCPGIKKGDYIATTGEHASTDEVVVTGQHMAWRRSYMYSILGEVGGKKGSLDESQNPFIWSKKEITAVTDFEMQVAMAWATGPVAEWGIAGALARYRALTAVSTNTNVVYRGLDAAGIIRYVGITSRDPAIRFAEHLGSGTARSFLEYEVIPGAINLTRIEARIFEQRLINQFGLQRNGGLLLNRINSIARRNWPQFGI